MVGKNKKAYLKINFEQGEKMKNIRIVSKTEVEGWVYSLHTTNPNVALGMLFAGDRWSCVKEVVLASVDDKIIGIATIAPKGEVINGDPTIVAVYVIRDFRSSGIGYELLETSVDYMISKGMVPIRIDVMNSKVFRMIKRLPIEKQEILSIADHSMGGALDIILDM